MKHPQYVEINSPILILKHQLIDFIVKYQKMITNWTPRH